MVMKDKVLEVQSLSKRFGDIEAVKDLNLTIYTGDVYGFIGPNGAGKTTTIRMLLGLIHPDKGEVKLFGRGLYTDFRNAIHNIGALVEAPAFYPYLSGYMNLKLFGKLSGGVTRERIIETLNLVGLGRRGKHKVKGYSQGMKQRLGIGLALLHKPRLLILDEPTNGLDPQGIREVRNLIRKISQEEKITIFLSSHLLGEMEMVCNRIGIIYRGQILKEGPVDELLGQSQEVVEINVDKHSEAKEFLEREFQGLNVEIIRQNWLSFRLGRWDTFLINKRLLDAGFKVFSFAPRRRTLEEFFVELTGESQDVF